MNSLTSNGAACLDLIETKMYRYLYGQAQIWKNHAYFTQHGVARLGSISGYILGIKHAGNVEMAEKLAQDFMTRMAHLTMTEFNPATEDSLLSIDSTYALIDSELLFGPEDKEPVTVKVPRQKVVLHDDGCLHSFSFSVYYPVSSAKYWECFKKYSQQSQPHLKVMEELKIIETINDGSEFLTEFSYKNAYQYKQYYSYGYNGGLIYHGPGAGQTFAVTLSNDVLWSIHT